jgi:hypothetical protein
VSQAGARSVQTPVGRTARAEPRAGR